MIDRVLQQVEILVLPMTYFLYKLVSPRPTFSLDMTDAESAITRDHVGYWTSLAADGTAAVIDSWDGEDDAKCIVDCA
ncbi:MAG: hypothetical protein ABR615_00385 [Pseudonocardiaceae bacterium]